MASINYDELAKRAKGLTVKQLESVIQILNTRLKEVRGGAKIEPYQEEWSEKPLPPTPSWFKRGSTEHKKAHAVPDGLHDDDIPF